MRVNAQCIPNALRPHGTIEHDGDVLEVTEERLSYDGYATTEGEGEEPFEDDDGVDNGGRVNGPGARPSSASAGVGWRIR